ncbi:C-terminal helicase domain-containing protein [Micromonospora chalcea]
MPVRRSTGGKLNPRACRLSRRHCLCVYDHDTSDTDDDSLNTAVPFQVAYAVSIHKAQGLEYDSVKIVTTDANEDDITHSIFYTAGTRGPTDLLDTGDSARRPAQPPANREPEGCRPAVKPSRAHTARPIAANLSNATGVGDPDWVSRGTAAASAVPAPDPARREHCLRRRGPGRLAQELASLPSRSRR